MGRDGGAGRGLRVDAAAGRGWRRRATTAWGMVTMYFCGEAGRYIVALLAPKKGLLN
jgi:hypothetical protein